MCAIDEETLKKISGAMDSIKKKAIWKCPNCHQSSFFDSKNSEEKHLCPYCKHVWYGVVV